LQVVGSTCSMLEQTKQCKPSGENIVCSKRIFLEDPEVTFTERQRDPKCFE
jgi:hypothetical protein